MAATSRIEWTDSTFNSWIGCTKVSPACDNCYAAVSTPARTLGLEWGAGQPRRRTSPANWKQPLRWNARPFWQCKSCGWRGDDGPDLSSFCPSCCSGVVVPARRRVFCSSLADVFDNEVDPAWRADLFELIKATPNLDWLLLTKRIGNAGRMIESAIADLDIGYNPAYTIWPWPNVWLGITICNQAEADRDIPKLVATTAAVRFLSIEPMLGRVDLCEHLGMWWNQMMGCFESNSDRWNPRGLDWVICGGESGHGARPMHPEWARSLRDQCAAVAVPFLFKQWGEWHPSKDHYPRTGCRVRPSAVHFDGRVETRPEEANFNLGMQDGWVSMCPIGKKAAGRLLDDAEHNQFPAAPAAF